MLQKISFDFDCTLACVEVQEFARDLKLAGHKICITTTRLDRFRAKYEDANNDLFAVADLLGITEINFTNLKDKVEFFIDKPEYIIHLDDCKWEVEFMLGEPRCKTIPVLWWDDPNWRNTTLKILEGFKLPTTETVTVNI